MKKSNNCDCICDNTFEITYTTHSKINKLLAKKCILFIICQKCDINTIYVQQMQMKCQIICQQFACFLPDHKSSSFHVIFWRVWQLKALWYLLVLGSFKCTTKIAGVVGKKDVPQKTHNF